MELLSRELLGTIKNVPFVKEEGLRPEKVLQFGEGNFLRAFIDWMIDEMNSFGEFNGNVVIVQPLENGLVEMLNDQDGLYTLMQRGILDGETIDSKKIITSVSRGLNPYSQWDAYLETARNPEMELVVSNTTEAGIAYKEEAFVEGKCPANFPAKLLLWLNERFNHFKGDSAKGVIIMPCELINYNGTKLKECLFQFIEAWGLGSDLKQWIEESCTFLSTLVDRIVPGYPRDEIDAITQELGYKDNLVDTGEIFHLMVVEGASEEIQKKLPFGKAGLNVIFTDDMQPYRTRKVAILNGAHTGSVLGAYMAGVDTVGEMINDDELSTFLKKMMLDEIVPVLDLPEAEKKSYAEAILERFGNPFVRHELLSISLNSVSKWKVRVLPSLKGFVEQQGKVPARLAFSLAALIAFYKGEADAEGKYQGTRGDAQYLINDAADVCEYFANAWKSNDSAEIVAAVLSNQAFWGEDLTAIAGLKEVVTAALTSIIKNGSRAAIKENI